MTDLASIVVTVNDLRAAGHCVGAGTRFWFAGYGLDFRDFVKRGLPADAWLATGDGQAEGVFLRTLARLQLADPRIAGESVRG